MVNKLKALLKVIGPGLLFASTAVGTSHLVLSTRAGGTYGLVIIGIVLISFLFKYPFFEFGTRYANVTKYSLIKGYRKQGKWAVILFLVVITIDMFAVVGAIAAVCGGLLSTIVGLNMSMSLVVGLILVSTALILVIGGYSLLDNLIKVLTVILLITISVAFFAVLTKGPAEIVDNFESKSLIENSSIVLLISLIGWMPAGMETSTMTSIWVAEKIRKSDKAPKLSDSILDFRLGYVITIILALMFVIIGAYTMYGTGQTLDGSTVAFSKKLIHIFVKNIGNWAYPIIAIAAFGTIYGTLITAWDAFSRSFVRTLRILVFKNIEMNTTQQRFLNQKHKIAIPVIGLGGFLLFYFSSESMITLLETATILSFLTAPVIAFLNLKAILGKEVPIDNQPSKKMVYFSYLGIAIMTLFSLFYLYILVT